MLSASGLAGTAAAVRLPGAACGGPDQPTATCGRKRQKQTAQRTNRLGASR